MMKLKLINILFIISIIDYSFGVYRNGTTSMNFLEVDIASSQVAMGGASVSYVKGASSTYWNPAGLAFANKSEVLFFNQSWIADINHTYTSAILPLANGSAIGFSLNAVSYGDIEVTTLEDQDGTGEFYSPIEYSAGVSYARKFVDWFGFGSSIKYIRSQIWHSSASAFSMDLGVQIYTDFMSSSKGEHDGVKIGMSISNYGTRVKYDGLDLYQPIDISDEYGNYSDVWGQFHTSKWELPILFRLGVSNDFIKSRNQSLNIAIDAIHPNNDKERINLGMEYSFTISELYNFYLRGGYKGISIEGVSDGKIQFSSPFGPAYGLGLSIPIQKVAKLKADYTLRFVGRFGMIKLITLGLEF